MASLIKTLLLICICSPLALASPMIELTDANRAILKLELSKGVELLQNALKSNFEFDSVATVSKFLFYCGIVEESMQGAKDGDYEGMAATIKSLLAEKSIADACKVDLEKMKKRYSFLDRISVEEHDEFRQQTLIRLTRFNKEVNEDASLNLVLGKLLSKKIKECSEALLERASNKVEMWFGQEKPQGWFGSSQEFRQGCDISHLKPICKFVRGSNLDEITVTGGDIAIFRKVLSENNEEVIKRSEEMTGMSLNEMKEECEELAYTGMLNAISLVDDYIERQFISKKQLNEAFKKDGRFHFYYELNQMCRGF